MTFQFSRRLALRLLKVCSFVVRARAISPTGSQALRNDPRREWLGTAKPTGTVISVAPISNTSDDPLIEIRLDQFIQAQ